MYIYSYTSIDTSVWWKKITDLWVYHLYPCNHGGKSPLSGLTPIPTSSQSCMRKIHRLRWCDLRYLKDFVFPNHGKSHWADRIVGPLTFLKNNCPFRFSFATYVFQFNFILYTYHHNINPQKKDKLKTTNQLNQLNQLKQLNSTQLNSTNSNPPPEYLHSLYQLRWLHILSHLLPKCEAWLVLLH